MTVAGYTDRRARLAYRTAQRPELAVDLHNYFERTWGGADGRERLAATLALTRTLVDWWEKLTVVSLAKYMSNVAAVSKGQIACFSAIFRDAGIELSDVDLPEPGEVEFAWSSVAHASVLASLDVLADTEGATLSAEAWVAECLAHLDSERFRRASGIDPQDHARVLEITTEALISNRPDRGEIGYRDRLFSMQWTRDELAVSNQVLVGALQGVGAGI